MSDPPPTRSPRALTPDQRLWQLWRQGHPPEVRTFLAGWPDLTPSQVSAVVAIDQYERWQRGERPTAEDYLRLLPDGMDRDQAACDIVYGEFLLREQLGEQPSLDDYRRRFPQAGDLLARQLEVHSALGDSIGPVSPRTIRGASILPTPVQVPDVPGYEVLEEIGRGGMGVVYKARQVALDRLVALKVLRVQDEADSVALERMNREAQMTARLSHPRIVAIHDAGRAGSFFYFAMEYVPGIDLHKLVTQQGPLPAAEAAEYLKQAADALAHAHAAGLVHRDIKPSNLIVTPGGQLKLLDLGLARQAGLGGDAALTQAGTFMGTPDFIAPEQANDARSADARSDLYSLGCTFFFALTGHVPYEGDTPLAKLMQHHAAEVPSPARYRPDLPAHLVTVLARLMMKRPEARYQTAGDLYRALASPVALAVGPRSELLFRLDAGEWVKGVSFAPGARTLAAAGLDGRVRLYDLTSGQLLWCGPAAAAGALCVVFGPDGRWLAWGGEDGVLHLIDVPARAERWQSAGHADHINSVTAVANGAQLLTASHDGTLRLWDVASGRSLRQWPGHAGPVWGVSADPDGTKALSCGQDRYLRLWGAATGEELSAWPQQGAALGCVALSPDGRRALAGQADGVVRVWDVADRRPVLSVEAHTSRVTGVAWSPQGTHFVSGGRDQVVKVWAVGASRPVLTLSEHTRWVACVAWADGMVASGGADRAVCVWRVEM